MQQVYYDFMPSPVGKFLTIGTDSELHFTAFAATEPFKIQAEWRHDAAPLLYAISPLERYFAGEAAEFDIAISPSGTEFQLSVWQALCGIKYGETASYGEIAAKIGNKGASRAVGRANNANPIPIIIPCHRIIGADGSMTGFGGGIKNKKILLQLEGITIPAEQLTLI